MTIKTSYIETAFRIDLTRMECKESCDNCVFQIAFSIDLTRMECKVLIILYPRQVPHGIDLTRMECKDQRDPVTAAS